MNLEIELDDDESFAYGRIVEKLGEQREEDVDPEEHARDVLVGYIAQEFPKVFNGQR